MVTRKIIVIEDKRKEPTAPGYGSSGESLWSRHAAHGHSVDTRPTRERMSWSRLDHLIKNERAQVAKMERRTQEVRGTDKHPMLCVKLQRLRHFLARLEAEQRELTP
jgi:hypothetical protein